MNMLVKKGWISTIILLFCFYSCTGDSDNNFDDLLFENDTYSVFIEGSKTIPIVSGNGSYDITLTDQSVASFEYSEHNNCIVINGKNKGNTDLVITDKISTQKKTIKIIIIDQFTYVSLKIMDETTSIDIPEEKSKLEQEIQNNKFLSSGNFITLISSTNVFYLFDSKENAKKGDYIKKGYYEIIGGSAVDEQRYIRFKYEDLTYDCYFKNDLSYLTLVGYFLQRPITPRSAAPYFIALVENFAERYSLEYPDLVTALITYNLLCYSPKTLELPGRLLLQ